MTKIRFDFNGIVPNGICSIHNIKYDSKEGCKECLKERKRYIKPNIGS